MVNRDNTTLSKTISLKNDYLENISRLNKELFKGDFNAYALNLLPKLSQSKHKIYRCKKHLMPYFKNKLIHEITPKFVKDTLEKISKE